MNKWIVLADAATSKAGGSSLWIYIIVGVLIVLGIYLFVTKRDGRKHGPTDENAKVSMRDDVIRQDTSATGSDPLVERALSDSGEPKVIQTDEMVEQAPNVEKGDQIKE